MIFRRKDLKKLDLKLKELSFKLVKSTYVQGIFYRNYKNREGWAIHLEVGKTEEIFGEEELWPNLV